MTHLSHLDQRRVLLDQLASITTLERGTLAEEFRERPGPEGSAVRLGPYFKHQCWEHGHNRSRRVPATEIERLRQDLQSGQRFDQITAELADLAIAEGRRERSTLNAAPPPDAAATSAGPESKKKAFTKRRARKDTAKPKPSSRKSPPVSRKKA